MANTISNDNVRERDYLNMSNSLTGIFIDTLCLAGSDIAKEEYQKDIMIWFAQRDWSLLGLGIIGFDITEIIWDKSLFQHQKKFILKVIERALEKANWNQLSYEPREDWIMSSLKTFKRMIEEFNLEHIEKEEIFEIIPFGNKYQKCEKHQIYLHIEGCVICNNE
ncbi:hypothetical protein [Bernardetia sp.]|uniref:hypothetical protein n=1 Tax=Bernardetia sp. TaxID=1937974 RepID=UPI0025BF2CB9|nr:hypothetical protein [Bernardetia sp.]